MYSDQPDAVVIAAWKRISAKFWHEMKGAGVRQGTVDAVKRVKAEMQLRGLPLVD